MMKDTEQSISSMAKNQQKQEKTPLTMMQLFSRAMTDCLNDEMDLLNEDIEEDIIFSSIKNLISEEFVEFREDMGEDYRMLGEGKQTDGDDGHIMMAMGNNNGHNGQDDVAILQSMIENSKKGQGNGNHDGDDERSDFLVMRNNEILQEIPSLISFKPKKRRRNPYDEESQSQIRSPATKSNGSNYNNYINNNYYGHRHQVEEEAAANNQKPLKLSRWRKKGLLKFRKNKNVSSSVER